MAESDSGEKTEEPTSEKLRKAREEGQVAKSTDAVTALVFVGTMVTLFMSMGFIGNRLQDMIIESIGAMGRSDIKPTLSIVMTKGFYTLMLVSMPVAVAVFVFGLVGNYFQIGFLLTLEPLKPKFDKISPINGIKQMFSLQKLVELLKQIVKFTIVAWIVYVTIKQNLRDLILTQRMEIEQTLAVATEIIKNICLRVGALFLVVAAADFFFQRYNFNKKMMMSRYEVKQEYKQQEGDPHVKSERKRLAQELIMQGSVKNTAKADAVITNPAHIAVAVKYNKDTGAAPAVVAKGMRLIAEQIKDVARHNKVPILRNVPLAAALNKLEIDEEIPEELYEAVAEVLNFVYELKKQGKA